MNLLKGLENLNKFLILATLTIHSLIWPNTGYSEAINYRNDFIISDLPRINDHLDHRTVIDVAIDPSGSLWILNIDGVFVYNGAILHYIFDLEILHQNFENMYDVRFSESQENIVLFDKSRSLNIETETFSLSKPDYINLASSCIKPKISAERHIVQTDDNGCWTHLIIDSLGVLPVKDMTTLGHSVDAFATQNGLIIYSEKHGYSLLNSSNSTLFDSDVTAVTADSTNNLIIGTYSGIQVLKLKDFSFLSRNFMGKDLNSITKVEDFENGEIAVLTIDHLAIFDDDWSIKASVPVPQTAMAIAKSKESIIVGGTGKRHCVLDIHSQPYKCDPSQKLGEINGISSLLYYESWDRIIGTSIEGQIFSIEPKTTNLSQILTLDRNTVFLEPFGDSVFITGGIDNLAITKIEFVDTDTWNVTPIKSWNVSNVIFYDALIYENSLFIATSEGLAEINIADFRNMSASDLLKQRLVTGKHIFSVEQNSEFVAFTSADRIHLANKENLSTLEAELVLKDLVRNFEFDFGVSKVIGESLVFGGSAGLAIIAGSITPTPPPKLNFTSFAVKGEQMKIAAPLHQIQDITLPHDAYHFSAGFAVMDYINPNRSVYKYKLEGLDDDWIDGGNTPSATYTNLSPGDYTLEVIGANADGVWNNEGISIDIKVKAAPWATWWAYTLYALAAIIVFSLFKRHYDTVQLQIKAVALSREMVEATEGNTETLYHRLERFKHLLNSRDTLFQSMLADITTLLCKTSPEDQAELTSEHIIACALRLHKELISQRSETSYYISELIYLAFEHYQDNKSPEQPTYIPLVNVADSSLEVRESLYLYSLMVAILEWLPYNFQLNHVTNTALNITTLENEAGQLQLQVTLGHSLLSSAALHTDRLLGPLLRLTTFLIQVDETNLNRMVITAPRLS